MVERIKKIIEKEGSNPSSFADTIGISRASMNHILNGRNNPSLDVIVKILSKYENISNEWLLFGKLPMYKGEKAYLQPTLFDEIAVNEPIEPKKTEYRKEIEVKPEEIMPKPAQKEEITFKKNTTKKIERIMIFYSDNTFDSFSPDK